MTLEEIKKAPSEQLLQDLRRESHTAQKYLDMFPYGDAIHTFMMEHLKNASNIEEELKTRLKIKKR